MTVTKTAKTAAPLKLGDRLDIIRNKRAFAIAFPIGMLLFIVLLFTALTGGAFMRQSVIVGILDQSLIVGTMAIGVSFIYTIGEIDFSVGNGMGLAAAVGAVAYTLTGSAFLMIVVDIAVALVLMMFNCTLGITFRLKSAMVAIVAMSLYGALSQEIVGPNPIKIDYATCKALEGSYRYIFFALYFAVCLMIYHNTTVGRKLRFLGGNETCAQQTGITVKTARYAAFLMAGVGMGLAATFSTIRTASVANSIGGSMGMDVMLATVLGGMSIFGGARSNSYAGLIGALTVTALNKGLLMLEVPSTLIQGARGIIFLLLVLANSERPASLPSRQQV